MEIGDAEQETGELVGDEKVGEGTVAALAAKTEVLHEQKHSKRGESGGGRGDAQEPFVASHPYE